jgi:hypothetical protein
MYLPEEEAKKKACCKTAPYLEGGRLVTPACLASGCMAWRETEGIFSLKEGRFLVVGESYSSVDKDYELRPTGRGYCGLVGRPE